jgi:hypothetical protein
MDILFDDEQVKLDAINGTRILQTAEVGQRMMAAALHTPVSVLTTAGEGGAWGIALLAAIWPTENGQACRLAEQERVRLGESQHARPSKADVDGFNLFLADNNGDYRS